MKIHYKKLLQRILGHFGYKITAISRTGLPEIEAIDSTFVRLFETYKAYTMTSSERMYALYRAVKYVLDANIAGDIVECGVWKGGSSMIIADILRESGSNKKIFLYDTFEGMSEPTTKDVDASSGRPAIGKWKSATDATHTNWCYASLDEVTANMQKTGYNSSNIVYVKGKVEETIPDTTPETISLLRLDTDWYESSYHELQHLFPLLVKGGVLILDDYGHWLGSREATDTYFKKHGVTMLLNRVDYTGYVGVKT